MQSHNALDEEFARIKFNTEEKARRDEIKSMRILGDMFKDWPSPSVHINWETYFINRPTYYKDYHMDESIPMHEAIIYADHLSNKKILELQKQTFDLQEKRKRLLDLDPQDLKAMPWLRS